MFTSLSGLLEKYIAAELKESHKQIVLSHRKTIKFHDLMELLKFTDPRDLNARYTLARFLYDKWPNVKDLTPGYFLRRIIDIDPRSDNASMSLRNRYDSDLVHATVQITAEDKSIHNVPVRLDLSKYDRKTVVGYPSELPDCTCLFTIESPHINRMDAAPTDQGMHPQYR